MRLAAIILFAFFCFATHAQNEPMSIDTNAVWLFTGPTLEAGVSGFGISGTISINDTAYFAMDGFDYCAGDIPVNEFEYLREDSGKWYFRPSINASEYLMFDFNLQVGDSISVPDCFIPFDEFNTLIVNEINEVIMEDGNVRRQLALAYSYTSNYNGSFETWIEGIGNTWMGYRTSSSQTCIDTFISMRCYVEDDVYVYSPPGALTFGTDCCNLVGVKQQNMANFTIYPNPASKTIYVQSPCNSSQQIEIFNSQGQRMKSIATNRWNEEISVEDLSAGIFIVRVTNFEGEIWQQTIVHE